MRPMIVAAAAVDIHRGELVWARQDPGCHERPQRSALQSLAVNTLKVGLHRPERLMITSAWGRERSFAATGMKVR
jgi:hypothetical protein